MRTIEWFHFAAVLYDLAAAAIAVGCAWIGLMIRREAVEMMKDARLVRAQALQLHERSLARLSPPPLPVQARKGPPPLPIIHSRSELATPPARPTAMNRRRVSTN